MNTEKTQTPAFNAARIKEDFPILSQEVNGKPLVYLDNAASTQKPQCVIDAVANTYAASYANIHRGVHHLSQKATDAYEAAREKSRGFVGAQRTEEIIFVRGTTEAINLVASTFGEQHVASGDEIVITHLEHHSNIVPWQVLCQRKQAALKVIPVNNAGEVDLGAYKTALSSGKVKLAAIIHVSNALGTINPVKEMVAIAHEAGVPVLVDGAQAAPHVPINVQEMDCDFYVFSGHKIYGPSGVGVLYGKYDILDKMPPYQFGGDMILSVTFEKTLYNSLPYRFEAGTPNIVGVIGLGAAIDYIRNIGLEAIAAYEQALLDEATRRVLEIPGLRLIGTAAHKAGIVSFVLDKVHPHDIGTVLDQEGIAIRAGHHCVQPLMQRFGVPATARASLGVYNTTEDIDRFIAGIHTIQEIFGA